MNNGHNAWSTFWQAEPDSAGGATLANLPSAIQALLDTPWRDLSRTLPPKTKVLDLATGGGIVLSMLRQLRRDLHLTGVDAVSQLPVRTGMKLRAGISTDSLPFPDESFGAVTSRFGIEYGSLEAGAAEAARVLALDGVLCLVIHHADSSVLKHNQLRKAALQWAAFDSGWVDKAIAVVRARRSFMMPTPPALKIAANDAAKRYSGQSAAWEFLTGLAQLLDAGANEAAVRALAMKADSELARIATLADAACDAQRLGQLTESFRDNGVAIDPPTVIMEPGGLPLAWYVKGKKACRS